MGELSVREQLAQQGGGGVAAGGWRWADAVAGSRQGVIVCVCGWVGGGRAHPCESLPEPHGHGLGCSGPLARSGRLELRLCTHTHAPRGQHTLPALQPAAGDALASILLCSSAVSSCCAISPACCPCCVCVAPLSATTATASEMACRWTTQGCIIALVRRAAGGGRPRSSPWSAGPPPLRAPSTAYGRPAKPKEMACKAG